jgi:hypothetical protein
MMTTDMQELELSTCLGRVTQVVFQASVVLYDVSRVHARTLNKESLVND